MPPVFRFSSVGFFVMVRYVGLGFDFGATVGFPSVPGIYHAYCHISVTETSNFDIIFLTNRAIVKILQTASSVNII